MKKILQYFIILLFSYFLLSQQVFAVDTTVVKIDNTAEIHELSSVIDFGTFVCKGSSCNVNNASDWHNYSSTSNYVAGDRGEGITLTANPGDAITFLCEVKYVPPDDRYNIHPVFNINFTNGNYLESINYFTNENADLDNDSIDYVYQENNVVFSTLLHWSDPVQLGAITAKIKSDTPDGTIIEEQLSTDGDQFLAKNPFIDVAHAASVAQSSVRILVSTQATVQNTTENTIATTSSASETPTTVSTQTLPETGKTINVWRNYLLWLLTIGIISLVIYKIIYIKIKSNVNSKRIH